MKNINLTKESTKILGAHISYNKKSQNDLNFCKIIKNSCNVHFVKCVQIQSFFWSVFSRIRTRKNSVFGHFSRSGYKATTYEKTNFGRQNNNF